jgi:hypothetical protein
MLCLNERNFLQLVGTGAQRDVGVYACRHFRRPPGRPLRESNYFGRRDARHVEQLHFGRRGCRHRSRFQPVYPLSSIDALQKFKVVSGIYPAEFGREAAQINVSAKSGTNDFRVPSQQRISARSRSTSLLPVLQKLPCTQTVWRFTPTTRTR